MQYIIKDKDGPARTGDLIFKVGKTVAPNILFVKTSRINPPKFADFIISDAKTDVKKIGLKVGRSQFSTSKKGSKDELTLNDFIIYPKDVPEKMHFSSIEHNCKKSLFYITPANIESIDEIIKNNKSSIFIVSSSHQLYSQQLKFVDFIVELRNKIGYEKLIYLPGIAYPSNIGLFCYMGIDLFDSTPAIVAARNNTLLFSADMYNKDELKEIPCSCPICCEFEGNAAEMDFHQILNHNYFSLFTEIKHVRNAIKNGNIRNLVDSRVRCDAHLTSIFKILDLKKYDYYEKRTPISNKNILLATSKESLFRPEIKRFQQRLLQRYIKPKCANVLLLLPCSAKKPYSFSKSHRFFRDILINVSNPFVVHEVIITSPIGIVPRELELTYPASNYDIAVTGHWDEDEKKIIRYLLKNYIKNSEYQNVIVHLPPKIQDFTLDLLKNPKTTCIDKPTSKESLDELSKVLNDVTSSLESVGFSERTHQNILSLAAYQFGREIAEELLANCIIKGKYPFQKIIYNNKQLGMITLNRGLISLTLEGAKRIFKFKKYWIEIFDDFNLKGSVFAPGVKDSDESIRIGDEVIVLINEELAAVGVAQMNGEEMKSSTYGEAVKIRHRI